MGIKEHFPGKIPKQGKPQKKNMKQHKEASRGEKSLNLEDIRHCKNSKNSEKKHGNQRTMHEKKNP